MVWAVFFREADKVLGEGEGREGWERFPYSGSEGLKRALDAHRPPRIPGYLLGTAVRLQVNRLRTGFSDACHVGGPEDVEKVVDRLVDDACVLVQDRCVVLNVFPGGIERHLSGGDMNLAPRMVSEFPISGAFASNNGEAIALWLDKGSTDDSGSQPARLELIGLPVDKVPEVADRLRGRLGDYLKKACPCDVRVTT